MSVCSVCYLQKSTRLIKAVKSLILFGSRWAVGSEEGRTWAASSGAWRTERQVPRIRSQQTERSDKLNYVWIDTANSKYTTALTFSCHSKECAFSKRIKLHHTYPVHQPIRWWTGWCPVHLSVTLYECQWAILPWEWDLTSSPVVTFCTDKSNFSTIRRMDFTNSS